MRTLAQVNWVDGYKPRCQYCFVPCDPRSREYRGNRTCPYCYDWVPLTITKKEMVCKPT